MSIISRITTWTIGQVLKAADLNGEFNNITNLLNNLDAATTTWTNVKGTTINALTLQINGANFTYNTYASYAPTVVGGGTVSSNAGFWFQVGKMIYVTGSFVAGTPTAVAASITVPSGKTIDTTLVTNGIPLGTGNDLNTGAISNSLMTYLFSDASDTSKLFLAKAATSGAALSKGLGSSIWTAADVIVYQAWVPVTS